MTEYLADIADKLDTLRKKMDEAPKFPVNEAQMLLILMAVEHGFRECERGKNLQDALASVHKLYRVESRSP